MIHEQCAVARSGARPFQICKQLYWNLSVQDSHLSRDARKPVFWVSDHVRHRPGCTVTEDGQMLENLDLERKRIVSYPGSKNKDNDQLRGHREADLRLWFRICRLLIFPCTGSFTLKALSKNSMAIISV